MGGQDGSARVVSERTASAVATTPTETAPTAHRFSRGRKVPKERIDELWRRVKSTFLQKAPDLLKLVSSAAPIPYQITINQGFQIRHRLTCKHPIVCAATHPRLTRHQEEGHTSSLSESVDDLNAESGGADECEDKKRVESVDFLKSASVAAHTFVAVDRARCVRVWDMNASSTKLRHSKTLDEEISRIVLISKYSVYATATHRTTVEFITPKFEHITTLKTEHHVEFLKYFSPLNQLITVGPSTLTVWALKRTVTRGVTSIECSAKHSVNVMAENEEWISAVHLDHRTFRLFVAVNCRIIIFEMHTLRECRRVPRISRKKATAITYYEPFGFTVVGFSDGLVKIVNTSNTVLHFSHSQTKKITCLLVHPHGPFFLSASLDSTIKVFDMHVFKEVYTFHLRERPIDMHLIDDRWLMVQTEESVTILSLSNLLSSFSTITTKSLQMQRVSCTKKSDRILSLSAEGAIRLLSPNNGKVIATCLPFLEADKVLQIACSSLIERLFVLLDSKEIWVVSTEVNPCHVLDIWNMKYNEEKFITLCACEGRYGLKNKDFVLLLGGTTSGELVFFNYFGRMSERRQLHGSAIRNMVYRSDCNILVTTGDDNCIKLSSIDPEKKELLILIRTIDTDFTPRRISILDTCFCATNDDGIVSTYNFLNLANDWRKSQSHSSSDDHTESILSICPVEKLDLFVSASTDQTIKVWDTYNTLVREIKFFQPIRSIVTANKRGDLLVSLANRIDKIPAISYLPPGYLKSLNSMGQFSPNEEAQLPFDEDADVLKNYLALKFQFLHSHQGRFQFYREPYGPHLFPTLNFAVTPRSEFSFVKCDHDNQEKTLDEVAYLELMTQLGGLMQRRLKIIESAKRRLQMEKSEQAQKDRILDEEFDRFVKCRNLDVELFHVDELIHADGFAAEENIVSSPQQDKREKPVALSSNEDPNNDVELRFEEITTLYDPFDQFDLTSPEPVDIQAMTEIPIIDSEPIDTPAVPDGARVEEFVATPHVPRKALPKLAPDGAIPNSVMSRLFKDWGVQAFQRNATKSGVSMSKRISVSTTARPRPSKSGESGLKIPPVPEAKESFLDKLKKAMEEKERKIAELEQAHRATTADEDQEKIINFDDDDEDGVEGGRRRLPIVTRPLHLDLPGEAPQPKYPKIIEKALTFKWFPQDEIFYPPAPTPIDRRHPALPKPKGLLRMKVEPTGEALLSIILDCFRRATSPAVRGEIVSYLNWIHEEFGFRDTTALVRFFCRFLQSVPFIDMDEEEMELRQQIVGSLSSLGFQQIELVPSVLMQTIMPFEKLRAKASATLTAMGLLNDVHTLGKIREIFTDYEKVFAAERTEAKTRAETAASRTSKTPLTSINGRITPSTAQSETRAAPPITQSAGSLDFRNSIMTFLRRTLRKYLIRMAKDDETVAKLRELNESGLIDRSGKKALEEKEKEDLRMMALRERDRLKQAVLTAPVIQNEPKEKEKKKEKGSKKKKGPIVRQDMLERRTTQALVMVNRPKPKQETGPERPTSASSVILNAERGGDKLTQGKSYVTILQNPAVSDFIAALNCYEISVERRLAKEEKERLDRIARETEAAERARLEKEKQDAMADFMRKKEAERLLRVEQMRQRIALARMREESLPKVKSVTKAHGFHTLTRRSKCHGSRETMDYLFDTHHHDHHFHGNFISLHLQKLNKSMPVENVQLSPFGEEASHGSVGSRFRLPGIPEALPRESVFSLHPPKLRGSEQDSERRHDAHIHEEDTGAHHHHVHWSAEPDGTHGRRSSKVPAHAAGDIDSGEGGTSPAAMEVFRSNRKYFVFGTD